MHTHLSCKHQQNETISQADILFLV